MDLGGTFGGGEIRRRYPHLRSAHYLRLVASDRTALERSEFGENVASGHQVNGRIEEMVGSKRDSRHPYKEPREGLPFGFSFCPSVLAPDLAQRGDDIAFHPFSTIRTTAFA
jgi:hypothetical protein